MTTNPTPGPWYQAGGWLIVGKDGVSIAEVLGENTEANARLIAASPDLLEACERALPYIPVKHSLDTRQVVEAAIAKAKRER